MININLLIDYLEKTKEPVTFIHGKAGTGKSIFLQSYYDYAESKGDNIIKLAQQVGVKDLRGFENCWNQGKYKNRVFTDLQEGSQVGVQATPTFIVGIHDSEAATISGEMFSGAESVSKFTQTIEK